MGESAAPTPNRSTRPLASPKLSLVDLSFANAPAGFFALCRSQQLGKAPLSCSFAGYPIVLFRDPGGRPQALLDRCPHRGVALSAGSVIEGTLSCPYHGYRFDGGGQCVHLPGLPSEARIPKAMHTPSLSVVEQEGFVWVQAKPWGTEANPPRLPYLHDPGYHTAVWALTAQGTLIDGLENFLDATHTHFVHQGLIRRATGRRKLTVRVKRQGAMAEARYVDDAKGVGASTGLISRLLARDIDGRYGRFIAPCVAQLEYKRGEQTAMVISALFTPRTNTQLTAHAVVTTRHVPLVPGELLQALIWPLFGLAIRQDKRILALQAEGQRRFPGERPVPSPTDVLRPHMESLMQKGPSAVFTKDLTLEI